MNKAFSEFKDDYRPTELVGIVANNVREYAQETKESQSNILLELTNSIGNNMFKAYITYGDGISRASALGYPVFYLEDIHQNAAKQSEQIREIIKELLSKIGM